jgi:hypothetical protein
VKSLGTKRQKLLQVESRNGTCYLCKKFVPFEEDQSDEQGNLVHEPCLVARLAARSEAEPQKATPPTNRSSLKNES